MNSQKRMPIVPGASISTNPGLRLVRLDLRSIVEDNWDNN